MKAFANIFIPKVKFSSREPTIFQILNFSEKFLKICIFYCLRKKKAKFLKSEVLVSHEIRLHEPKLARGPRSAKECYKVLRHMSYKNILKVSKPSLCEKKFKNLMLR